MLLQRGVCFQQHVIVQTAVEKFSFQHFRMLSKDMIITRNNYKRLSYGNFHIMPRINLRLPYQPETPISARGPKARGLTWESRADTEVEG